MTDKKKETEGTRLRPCTCKSDYQDSRYGKGVRVHNNGLKAHVCTVCGNKVNS